MVLVSTLLFAVLLASAARAGFLNPSSEEIIRKKLAVQQDCSLQYNVPETYLKLLLEGGATESRNGKCFMKCGLVGMGYLNEDGSLNEKNLRNTINNYLKNQAQREFAINSWQECDQKCHSEYYADDSCDRAFNLAKCFIKKLKNSGFLPNQKFLGI